MCVLAPVSRAQTTRAVIASPLLLELVVELLEVRQGEVMARVQGDVIVAIPRRLHLDVFHQTWVQLHFLASRPLARLVRKVAPTDERVSNVVAVGLGKVEKPFVPLHTVRVIKGQQFRHDSFGSWDEVALLYAVRWRLRTYW